MNLRGRVVWVAGVLAATLIVVPGATASTISVNTKNDSLADDDLCSLREAVNAAQTNMAVGPGGAGPDCPAGDSSSPDVIGLDAVASGTYQLTGAPGDDSNLSGDLDFIPMVADSDLTIHGDLVGGTLTDVIDGGGLDRVLDLGGTANVTIDGVEIKNGKVTSGNGGGIQVAGGTGLTIAGGSRVDNNEALVSGGGIWKGLGPGGLSVSDSEIDTNKVDGGASSGSGGGIFTLVPLSLARSVIFNNTVSQASDGAIDFFGGAGLELAANTGNTSITDSAIAGNNVSAGEAMDMTQGAGVSIDGIAPVNLSRSTVSGNGLTGTGTKAGGGLMMVTGDSTLTTLNSTISGNDAGNGSGGGLFVNGGGSTSATLLQSTMAGNTATIGPGVASGATVTFRGTIIDQGASGCSGGTLIADAYNVDRGMSCVGAGPDTDKTGIDPLLGSLLFNGGPTRTHALGLGSQAIDEVPVSSCKDAGGVNALLVDQRGAERPFGAGCDAGAYERVTCNGLLPTILGGPGNDNLVGTALADVIVGSAGGDAIDSGGGADSACGGSGGDQITGGAGADQLFGETGGDTMLALDGEADSVNCGPDTDLFSADASLDTLTLCETDINAPPETPQTISPPPPAISPPATASQPPAAKKRCKKRKKRSAALAKKCKKRRR